MTIVKLDWQPGRDNIPAWNEICAWVMEEFGLPGDRFTFHATENYMEFHFAQEQDAIHTILRWS